MRFPALALLGMLHVVVPLHPQEEAPFLDPDGGGPAPVEATDAGSDTVQRQWLDEAAATARRLQDLGLMERPNLAAATLFAWPVQASGLGEFGHHGISNFVDQNPNVPNLVLDYNCGSRTYDLSSGYNHQGTDIFTWPFGWLRMAGGNLEAVAAAPGTIVAKVDGNFDQNCSMTTCTASAANRIAIQHADGTQAWYLHFKSGSLTAKSIGQTVAAGEFLGVIGSSGCSTGPHLHFELYTSPAQTALIDPYQGPCNSMNTDSWWQSQRDYRDSAINRLATHSAPPVFPSCPGIETTNEKRFFQFSETMYVIPYYRDQQANDTTQYSLVFPNGTTWQTWSHSSTQTYNSSYWWWTWNLPLGPQGRWTFRAVFRGVTYERPFWLGVLYANDNEDPELTWSARRP